MDNKGGALEERLLNYTETKVVYHFCEILPYWSQQLFLPFCFTKTYITPKADAQEPTSLPNALRNVTEATNDSHFFSSPWLSRYYRSFLLLKIVMILSTAFLFSETLKVSAQCSF